MDDVIKEASRLAVSNNKLKGLSVLQLSNLAIMKITANINEAYDKDIRDAISYLLLILENQDDTSCMQV